MDTSRNIFDYHLISRELVTLMLSLRPHIVRYWGDASIAEQKPDDSWVTAVDKDVENELARIFNHLLPKAYFLGEETHPKIEGSEAALLEHELVIIVDPIDGTREYMTGKPDFGTLVGIYRRVGERFVPFFGFTYRPISVIDTTSLSQGTFIFTTPTGASQLTVSLSQLGAQLENSLALTSFTPQTPNPIKIICQSASQGLLPEGAIKVPSSASIVDLLCPSLGQADAAISKSRFWDIAGPIAIATALNIPIWRLQSREPIESFTLSDFVQKGADHKWQLQSPIVIGNYW